MTRTVEILWIRSRPATASSRPESASFFTVPRNEGQAQSAGTLCYTSAMASDGPKSAYELAMERLRQKDREASVEDRPLSDEQKAAIAEARQFYTAKTAELDILHRSALASAGSHEEIERLNDNLRRDKERLANDRDRKIAQIRSQQSS